MNELRTARSNRNLLKSVEMSTCDSIDIGCQRSSYWKGENKDFQKMSEAGILGEISRGSGTNLNKKP